MNQIVSLGKGGLDRNGSDSSGYTLKNAKSPATFGERSEFNQSKRIVLVTSSSQQKMPSDNRLNGNEFQDIKPRYF